MPNTDETEIAARLAARLCHDLVGPAGGVVAGLDVLATAPAGEIGQAARELVDSAARRVLALIVFARAAYGWDAQEFAAATLQALARDLFRGQRATLAWAVEALSLSGPAARGLLILVQIASESLAAGGEARASARRGRWGSAVTVEAVGPKARLHPAVAAGLRGEPSGDAPGGRWILGHFLHAMVSRANGTLAVEETAVSVAFEIRLP